MLTGVGMEELPNVQILVMYEVFTGLLVLQRRQYKSTKLKFCLLD